MPALLLPFVLLAACEGTEDTGPGLGDCPVNPGEDLDFEQVARGGYGHLDDVSSLNETITFYDVESLNDWWLSMDDRNNDRIGEEVDFTTAQAVALLTSYDSESIQGSLLDGIQWGDDDQEVLRFRISFRCERPAGADPSYFWEVFSTPIVPASACHMEACSYE